mmetsp:Transcript_56192/g.133913  ORF Transcript_56192/g.133913 Transcript_56192/m.133913 type:complete len:385 (+) Transcript_56192:998-2152(+)
MVRVHQDWDAICRCHLTHVVSTCNCAQDRGLQHLLVVGQGLSSKERGASLRELHHHRPALLLASLQHRVDCACTCAIECRNGKSFRLGKLQQSPRHFSCNDSGLHTWDLPEAAQLGYITLQSSCILVSLDAVCIANPQSVSSIHKRGRHIIASTEAAQRPGDHWGASRLGCRQDHLLRSSDEVNAARNAGLAALVDGQVGFARASCLDFLAVWMQTAHMSIFSSSKQQQVHRWQAFGILANRWMVRQLIHVSSSSLLRCLLADFVDLRRWNVEGRDEVLFGTLVALPLADPLVTEEDMGLGEVPSILRQVCQSRDYGAPRDADGEAALGADGLLGCCGHFSTHSLCNCFLVCDDLHLSPICQHERRHLPRAVCVCRFYEEASLY